MVEVSNHHQLHHQEEAEHGGAPEIQTNWHRSNSNNRFGEVTVTELNLSNLFPYSI
jgi:hypothetical protein